MVMVQNEISNTKGIERTSYTWVHMDPKQPKSYCHITLLSYTCQLIDLSQGCEIFFPIQDARIFHRGPFKDSQKIFEEF